MRISGGGVGVEARPVQVPSSSAIGLELRSMNLRYRFGSCQYMANISSHLLSTNDVLGSSSILHIITHLKATVPL